MSNIDILKSFSILPIVDLDNIHLPSDGLIYEVPKDCKINFQKNNICRRHYEKLIDKESLILEQCPFGFSSFVIKTEKINFAFTGIIPFPRLGGELEKKCAKKFPRNKISIDSIHKISLALDNIYKNLNEITQDIISNSSKALHEIRKLNRVVKQNSEKLYKKDESNRTLLTIWKASEMMSQQFDVIEILANENLSSIPLNIKSHLFDLLYKCIQFNSFEKEKIQIQCEDHYRPRVWICDKTFHIIPNVLIGNATKYARPNSKIIVKLIEDAEFCIVRVTNELSEKLDITDKIFNKGVRFHKDIEGTGNGLYVAQLVAQQHKIEIKMEQVRKAEGIFLCEFSFKIKTID